MALTGDCDGETARGGPVSTSLEDTQGLSAEDVGRRFLWARRQGRPAWLWPDVPIEAWRSALTDIERAIGAVLAGARGVDLDGEPHSIGLAGYTSGTGPLLGLWLEAGWLRAREPIATALAHHLAHNRNRTKRMAAAAARIVGRLEDEGIRTLVFKGAHTGEAYFPEAGARPASDIDLLVAGSDASRAEAALMRFGLVCNSRGQWESSWFESGARREPRSLTHVHAEDPWSIDLHRSLNISIGKGTPLAALDLARPMASGARWRTDGRAGVLDQPLLLLHLATHAGAGWQNLTLLRQVELVLVIRQDLAAGRLCWDAFLDLAARTGAAGYSYPALCVADKLAPGVVPKEVLGACAAQTPPPVRLALQRLTPATAQRIDRNSVGEHFMWALGWRGRLRQLATDIFPAGRSWREFQRIYEARAWSLIRGTINQ